MGSAAGSLHDVAQLIQVAVAPIFLLMAVASTLMVFASRLARIVDRGRYLEAHPGTDVNRREQELRALEKRARLIYRAMTLGVCAALCVCALMTFSFIGPLFARNMAKPVALLFLLALFAYTAALVFLLQEVFLAISRFSLGLHDAVEKR